MIIFADIKAAIADDMDDTVGEYAAQIDTAVQAAIRYCERSIYYFNQTRDKTFSTVANQAFYDSADLADIETLLRAKAVFVENDGQSAALAKVPQDQMEAMSPASGKPSLYSYFAQRLRLYPVPDQVYTIRLQLSPYRLDPLAEDGDTNAWMTEAYDLVKARAKYILCKDTLKDANLAAEALNDYNDQHMALRKETDLRNGTGFVRPTDF